MTSIDKINSSEILDSFRYIVDNDSDAVTMILGIDYGTKKIGLALFHISTGSAMPYKIIANQGINSVIKAILSIINDHKISAVVVGLPLHSDGTESVMSSRVRQFISDLSIIPNLIVGLCDENLSTNYAAGKLEGTEKNPGTKDAVAAAVIVEEFMSALTRLS